MLDPAAVKLLAATLPLIPMFEHDGEDTNNYQLQDTRLFNRYNYDTKADWYRSEDHRIWGKFSNMDAESNQQCPMFGWPASGGAIGGGVSAGTGDTEHNGMGNRP